MKLCHYAMPGVVCKGVDAAFSPVDAGLFFCCQCVGVESIRTIFS